MVKCGVLFEVRTESLNFVRMSFGFKGLKDCCMCYRSGHTATLSSLLKHKSIHSTYQIKVCAIGVTVGVGCVHSQGHTIGKDGYQNQVLKWSESFVKEK
jgi:hypothetical protein